MIKLEEIAANPTFSSQLENKILYASHSNDISVAYQSTFTIKYVIDGTKQYNVDNQDLEVPKNHYLILNNSKIITEAKRGTKGLSLFLSPKLIHEIANFHIGHNAPIQFLEVIQRGTNQKVKNLLDSLVYLYGNDRMGLEQQKDDLFIAIAEQLIKEHLSIDNNFKRLKVVRHNTKRALYKSIVEARAYLDDNFREKIPLDVVSKNVGVSKYHLHRLFKEIHGKTPLAYLTSVRLQNAKNRLKYSKDPILEIAIGSGFDNTAYFSNVFKKYHGLSPTQYRKAI